MEAKKTRHRVIRTSILFNYLLWKALQQKPHRQEIRYDGHLNHILSTAGSDRLRHGRNNKGTLKQLPERKVRVETPYSYRHCRN